MLRKGETGLERLMPLCSLLKGVMLRRTKDDVGMPHRKLSALLARKLCLKLATHDARWTGQSLFKTKKKRQTYPLDNACRFLAPMWTAFWKALACTLLLTTRGPCQRLRALNRRCSSPV